MIRKVLSGLAKKLGEYLASTHHQPEGLVEVGSIGNRDSECPNKMVVTLVGLERESAGKMAHSISPANGSYAKTMPSLLLNLNVMMAAVYERRKYEESLSVLSDTLRFIQSQPKYSVDGMEYTIEMASMSSQEQNNVWTLLGGTYFPSVMCKVRRVAIASDEIVRSGSMVGRPDVSM